MQPVEPFLAMERAMGPDRAAAAIDTFTAVNPQWTGAQWADVLAALQDVDDQDDLLEMYPALDGVRWPYVELAVISLSWAAGGGIPHPDAARALALAAQAVTRDQLLDWIIEA